MLRDLLFSR